MPEIPAPMPPTGGGKVLPAAKVKADPAPPAKPDQPASTRPAAQTTTPVSLPSTATGSAAQKTAAEIRGRYAISIPSGDVLVVRRTDIDVRAPALFEEAIALGRVRSRLKGSADLPGDIAERSKISEGTVIIPFGANTSPDRAAEAISMVLAVDGVQRVRALFTNER
jgi:hypothetical protein